ncbi:MAG: D-aspartate ligase [Chloroflexota bacterium]|nr:D-aspartate ligase [Chloroflexota bacterium]
MKNHLDETRQLDRIEKLDQGPVPVVLDANWVNSLGIMRGLGKLGLKSVGINDTPAGVALYSRHAIGLVGPNPREDPQGLIDLLVRIGQRLHTKGVLFLTDDNYLKALSQNKAALEPYYHFTFPDYDVLEPLMDKRRQYRLADELGIATPRSLQVEKVEDLSKWAKDAYPVLVKGVSGKDFYHHYHKQVLVFQTQAELEAMLADKPDIPVLLQELIPGGEENLYTAGIYMNEAGEAKAVFTGRKLRQYPCNFGTCTVGESLPCADIVQPSIDLLRRLEFYGISQIEYKYDPRDGRHKLIEVNGRFWKWHSLATASGVNLAAAAYCDILGLPMPRVAPQRYGLKWLELPEDLRGIVKDVKAGEFCLGQWLRTVAPPFVFSVFAWDDPRPWWMMIWKSLTKMGG